MDDVTIARLVHVLSIVLWIGGVGFVTTALLPVMRRFPNPAQRVGVFEAVEGRFSAQARLTVLLAGLSGLYMLIRTHTWYRFALPSFWWMDSMVMVWLIFASLLFVLEPLVLHRRFATHARRNPEGAFRVIYWFHVILLAISLVTIAGAVAGSHGLLF